MLVSTPSGEVYTFADFEGMFHQTGFGRSELFPLPPSIFSGSSPSKASNQFIMGGSEFPHGRRIDNETGWSTVRGVSLEDFNLDASIV